MSYARMDHAAWVESNNHYANIAGAKQRRYKPKPEKLTPFQAKVMDICGMVGGGIYNAPINWDKVNWGSGIGYAGMFVPWRDGRMSTYDSNCLTLLVLLCHEARIRCSIRAKACGHFELGFWPRSNGDDIMSCHPNIDEAVARFRKYLPDDHRITYRAQPAEVVDHG